MPNKSVEIEVGVAELKTHINLAYPKMKALNEKSKKGHQLSVQEDIALNNFKRVINLFKASKKKGLF